MQKKLIALAVAGLASSAAFAQTNVTIYGIADAGYAYSTGDVSPAAVTNRSVSQHAHVIQSGLWNGSRIGFKGEEALGNGLKALFTLEYSLNIDTNNGIGSNSGSVVGTAAGSGGAGSTLQSRQTWVGLGGNFGTATVGRQYSPGYWMLRNDAMAGSTNSVWSRLTATPGMTITPNSAARFNNSIAYASPTWTGFSAKAIYGFGENTSTNALDASSGDGGAWAIAGNYANGPINVDLDYQQSRTAQSATPALDGKSKNEWYLGGSYDFKVVKLFASYQKMDRNDLSGAAGVTQKQDSRVWQIGVSAPIGANGLLMASYGHLKVDNGIINNQDSRTKGYGIAYAHSLSKRTSLYTGIVVFDNDNDTAFTRANVNDQVAVASGSGVAAGLNQTNTTFMAGISHSF